MTAITRTGEIVRHCREDLVFSYGQGNLDEPVILGATLELERDDPRELARRMQKQWIVRKASQPMGHQCAGWRFQEPARRLGGRTRRESRPAGHADRRRRGE